MSISSPDFPLSSRAQAFELCLHLSRDGNCMLNLKFASLTLAVSNRDALRENGVVSALVNAMMASYSLEITRMASQAIAFLSENGTSRLGPNRKTNQRSPNR